MPKVYRVMLEADNGPIVGELPNMLGARPETDIHVEGGQVSLNTGGLSVNGCPCGIPPTIGPRRLRGIIPGAKNSNPDGRRLWGSGSGPFVESAIFDHLELRPRQAQELEDRQKGYIEPDQEMSFDNYQQAIAATRNQWELDEQLNINCPICGQHQ